MINIDPAKRPKIDEVLDFEWFDYVKMILEPPPPAPVGKYGGMMNQLPDIAFSDSDSLWKVCKLKIKFKLLLKFLKN